MEDLRSGNQLLGSSEKRATGLRVTRGNPGRRDLPLLSWGKKKVDGKSSFIFGVEG